MIPSPGRVVHYTISEGDAAVLVAKDASHHRNQVSAGEIYPAMIVRVFGEPRVGGPVNLQVFLDGDCSYWATSRHEGDEPGQWREPPRV